MDVQLKRGILEICVLASLREGDSYGYKIIGDLSPCLEISESTLYPILKRLEGAGSLTVYSQEYNGRLRRYYRLTEAGQERIADFLESWKQLEQMKQYIETRGLPQA